MRLLRSATMFASVMCVTTWLCMSGASAPLDKNNEKPRGNGAAKASGNLGLLSRDGTAAVFTAGATERTPYWIVHAEFANEQACDAFKVEGAYPLTRFRKWADIMIEVRYDAELRDFVPKRAEIVGEILSKDVLRLELGGGTDMPPPPPNLPAEKTRQTQTERIVRGGVGDYKGKGVIVAVLDSGIDFRHADFIDYDADGKPTSRVLYFWDTFSETHLNGAGQPGPKKFPNGAPIGTLYSRDDLTRELRARAPRIHVWDTNGHGTACAGIAAGNGNAAGKNEKKKAGRMGAAPEADIVAIRLGQGERGIEHAALLGVVCEWLEQVGQEVKRPIVLSCSFGGQQGGRDGNLVKERQLDARFGPDAKDTWCRAICISAGNDGEKTLHSEVKFGGKDSAGILKWNAVGKQSMSIYFDTADLDDIVVEQHGPFEGLNRLPVLAQAPKIEINRITQKGIMHAVLLPIGIGEIGLYSRSGKEIRADAYMNGPTSAVFFGEPGKQIGSPGTAAQAITVGSYDFNDAFDWLGQELNLPVRKRGSRTNMVVGSLSSYSSPGPRRLEDDGVIKPDLAAPGQYYSAAAATNTDQGRRDTSGAYCEFNGTSAATPYTAGVVALMLQKNKNLTNAQIKKLLADHVTKVDKEGKPLDRKGWGNGKLDLNAVTKILENVPAP